MTCKSKIPSKSADFLAAFLFAVFLFPHCFLLNNMYAKATGTKKVILYGIHASDNVDRWSYMPIVKSYYISTATTVISNDYFTAINLKNALQNYNYFCIQTHGTYNGQGILANNLYNIESHLRTSGATGTYDANISSCSSTAFSNMKFAYIGACMAAPVANAIYNHGATTTIGYTKNVDSARNRFLIIEVERLFSYGTWTVAQADGYAHALLYQQYGMYEAYDDHTMCTVIYGNGSLKYV